MYCWRPLGITLLLLLPFSGLCRSLDTRDSVKGIVFFEKAADLYELGRRDSSAMYFKRAAPHLLQWAHYERYVNCLNALFVLSHYNKDWEGKEKYGHRAYEAAEKYLNSESTAYGQALGNLSTIYRDNGLYRKGIALIHKALAAFQSQEPLPLKELIQCYNNIGLYNRLLGDYHQALHYYFRALHLQEKMDGDTASDIAHTYQMIGRAYSFQKEYRKAITYYHKAEKLYKTMETRRGKNRLLRVYQKIATSYISLADYDKGQAFLDKAFALALRNKQNAEHLSTLYNRQARLYLEEGRHEEGKAIVAKALAIFEKNPQLRKKRTSYADLFRLSGELDLYAGRYEDALALFNRALQVMVPGFSPVRPSDNPDLRHAHNLKDFADISTLKARSLKKHYDTAPQRRELLEGARDCYRYSIRLLNELRRSYLNKESKLYLAANSRTLYEGALDVTYRLYRQTGEARYAEEAYYYLEQNKGLLLYEAFLDTNATFGLPDSLLQEELTLQKRISDETYQGGDSTKLFVLKEKYQHLTMGIKATYPRYYSQKYSFHHTHAIAQVQQHLNSKTLLISYFYGKEHVYLLAISKGSLHFLRIEELKNVAQSTDRLLRYLRSETRSSTDRRQQYEAAHTLYQLLIERVLKELPDKESIAHLLLIPDGPLLYVPFETLLTRPAALGKESGSAFASYLLNTYNISYQHSTSYWVQYRRTPGTRVKKKPWSGYAAQYKKAQLQNDASGDNLALMAARYRNQPDWQLPFAKAEVKAIAKIMKGDAYIGPEATKRSFQQQAADYHVLHLANHGLLDNEDSMYNRLVFTSENDTLNKADLFAYEVYNMRLPAAMVVLSACNTGVGRFNQGEGVMSLARAFAYAGARSVVTSLWQVPDESTATLMHGFYEALKIGLPKDEALRQAKLNYLEQQDEAYLRHPHFWAGLVAVGDTDPLLYTRHWYEALPSSSWLLLLLLLLAVAGSAPLVYLIKKKPKNL